MMSCFEALKRDPDVVGYAVQEDKVIVYVRRLDRGVLDRLPKTICGLRVEVVYSGEVRIW